MGVCDYHIPEIMRLLFVSRYNMVKDYLVGRKCVYKIRTLTEFRVKVIGRQEQNTTFNKAGIIGHKVFHGLLPTRRPNRMNGNIYCLCQKHYQENPVTRIENFVFLYTKNFLDMQGYILEHIFM